MKLKLISVILAFSVVLSSSALVLFDFPFNPFNSTWIDNLGKLPASQGEGSVIENGTLYWLSSHQNGIPSIYGSTVNLEAINLTNGHELWDDNLSIETYSNEQYLYWDNGNILLVTYAQAYEFGNIIQFFNIYGLLSMTINTVNGAISSIHRVDLLNSSANPPQYSSPLLFGHNKLFGYSYNQVGLSYIESGKSQATFQISVFGESLQNWTVWKRSFYVSGSPLMPSPQISLAGGTLSIVSSSFLNSHDSSGNTSFIGFNSSTGNSAWNFTSPGGFDNLWSSGNNYYFENSTHGEHFMQILDSSYGKISGSFPVNQGCITLVGDRFLSLENGSFTAFSRQGTLLWNTGIHFIGSNISQYSIMSLAPGFVLVTLIGTSGHYTILNISSGYTVWSRDYFTVSYAYGSFSSYPTPQTVGDGYLILSEISQNSELYVMAVNVNSL